MNDRLDTRKCRGVYNFLTANKLFLAGLAVFVSLGVSSLAIYTRTAAMQELDKRMPTLSGEAARTYLRDKSSLSSLRAAFDSVSSDVVPATDPLSQSKLLAPDGTTGDNFSHSLSISGDTAIVGAPQQDMGSSQDVGAAYIFVRNGDVWSFQQKLTGDGTASSFYGFGVAISGNTAISTSRPFSPNQTPGSAYVYVRNGTIWTLEQRLVGDNLAGDAFGKSVAIEGNTAAVAGGQNQSTVGAFVFVRSGTVWTLQQKVRATDSNGSFGTAISLSGGTLLVGASQTVTGPSGGRAYVFVRNGTQWTQEQKLFASDATSGDDFGQSVSISGETLIVGAPAGAFINEEGAAYIFDRIPMTSGWIQRQKLTASDAAGGDRFGSGVSILGDMAVVGSRTDDVTFDQQGSAYVFTRIGTDWTQLTKLTAFDGGLNDHFGSSIALSGDSVLVGAVFFPSTAVRGAAYVIPRCDFDPSECEAEIEVNITTDQPDIDLEDDVCDVDVGASGQQCSLRAAIQTANAKAGPDDITFNISGSGVHTISPLTQLPAITETVTIDATTQPGYTTSPMVELVGTSTTGGLGFFAAGSGNSTVRGLALNRFTAAIAIGSSGNRIEKCYIGLSPDGSAAGTPGAQQIGIDIRSAAATNNTIGGEGVLRNVISNNLLGVAISQGATGNNIVGNRIGTNPAGSAAIANTAAGVAIDASSNNTIGGATAPLGNLISGNVSAGVLLQNNATNNVVAGNLIGTNFDGTEAIPNAAGVNLLDSDNNQIGTNGTETATNGNTLSGNTSVGVYLQTNSSNNMIAGNKIGTKPNGTEVLPNGQHGIFLATGSAGNNIKFNVVGGHDETAESGGVVIGVDAGAGNTVAGNSIGVTADGGTVSLANRYGVVVFADGQTIGQSGTGENYISHNLKSGIWVSSVPGGPNPVVENVTITNNRVGTNGSADIGNAEFGIWLSGNVTECTVTGNNVAGNDVAGIALTDGAESNQVTSNFVGVNLGLTSGIPNSFGIWIRESNDNTVSENVIGGNVIGMLVGTNIGFGTASPIPAANRANLGTDTSTGGNYTTGNRIFGNIIGLGTGLVPIPNKTGIAVGENARSNFIGTAEGLPNFISGNTDAPGYGILLGTLTSNPPEDVLPRLNTFVKNRIGLGPNLTSISNTKGFVLVQAVQNTIGGDTDELANIIVASTQEGLSLLDTTRENTLLRNYIGVLPPGLGTRPDPASPSSPNGTYGNGSHGIFVANGAQRNTLGGTTRATGMVISGNGGNGIHIASTAGNGNRIGSNSISGNTLPGIDLGGNGLTPNDPTDADAGPNNLQNYPTMTLSLVGGDLIVNYQVDSAPANSAYGSGGIKVDFYEADSTGQGSTLLGTDQYLLSDYTNGTPGTRQKNLGNAVALGIVAGDKLTATATDADGNSSEFTPAVNAPGGAPGFEGDVAPRPNGDGSMGSTDITQLRRFVSGLDTPNPSSNELQRIDCAPRSTFGDGVVNSTDVVQGRRYIAGLDPMTAAGGPASRGVVPDSIFVGDRDTSFEIFQREVRIGDPEFSGANVFVPVELTSEGNEVAMSFTLEYDPSILANPRIVLGDDAPAGSVLTVNAKQPGRIGILIDSSDPLAASAARVRIVLITFKIASETGIEARFELTDSLAAQGVSDRNANDLSTRFVGSSLR